MASKLVNVTFTKHYKAYSAGEPAGFSKTEAERLVNLGLARYTATAGHAPLNASMDASSPKGTPEGRARATEAAREAASDPAADPDTGNLTTLSYNTLRSLAAEKARATGSAPTDFKRESLVEYLSE